MSLIMLGFVGRFAERHLLLALPFMPASLLGYWLAMRSVHLITSQMLRYGSLGLCAVAGIATVISYWM